jgi:hypothetical protein
MAIPYRPKGQGFVSYLCNIMTYPMSYKHSAHTQYKKPQFVHIQRKFSVILQIFSQCKYCAEVGCPQISSANRNSANFWIYRIG